MSWNTHHKATRIDSGLSHPHVLQSIQYLVSLSLSWLAGSLWLFFRVFSWDTLFVCIRVHFVHEFDDGTLYVTDQGLRTFYTRAYSTSCITRPSTAVYTLGCGPQFISLPPFRRGHILISTPKTPSHLLGWPACGPALAESASPVKKTVAAPP